MSVINGGHILTTGFAHDAVLSHADKIIAAIKKGAVKHIFLVGGCDGAHTAEANCYSTPFNTSIMSSFFILFENIKLTSTDITSTKIPAII